MESMLQIDNITSHEVITYITESLLIKNLIQIVFCFDDGSYFIEIPLIKCPQNFNFDNLFDKINKYIIYFYEISDSQINSTVKLNKTKDEFVSDMEKNKLYVMNIENINKIITYTCKYSRACEYNKIIYHNDIIIFFEYGIYFFDNGKFNNIFKNEYYIKLFNNYLSLLNNNKFFEAYIFLKEYFISNLFSFPSSVIHNTNTYKNFINKSKIYFQNKIYMLSDVDFDKYKNEFIEYANKFVDDNNKIVQDITKNNIFEKIEKLYIFLGTK